MGRKWGRERGEGGGGTATFGVWGRTTGCCCSWLGAREGGREGGITSLGVCDMIAFCSYAGEVPKSSCDSCAATHGTIIPSWGGRRRKGTSWTQARSEGSSYIQTEESERLELTQILFSNGRRRFFYYMTAIFRVRTQASGAKEKGPRACRRTAGRSS